MALPTAGDLLKSYNPTASLNNPGAILAALQQQRTATGANPATDVAAKAQAAMPGWKDPTTGAVTTADKLMDARKLQNGSNIARAELTVEPEIVTPAQRVAASQAKTAAAQAANQPRSVATMQAAMPARPTQAERDAKIAGMLANAKTNLTKMRT